jgi:hypothetical protein
MRLPELEKALREAEEKVRQLRIAKEALARIGAASPEKKAATPPSPKAVPGEKDGTMAPGFLMNAILDLLRDGGERGPREIADLVGTTPDSCSKSLTLLKGRGELNSRDGKWFVVQRALTNGVEATAS